MQEKKKNKQNKNLTCKQEEGFLIKMLSYVYTQSAFLHDNISSM